MPTPIRTERNGKLGALFGNMEQVMVGKPEAVRLTVAGLLAEGHLLIEDVPGVGKTTLAQALARSIDGIYRRIQFTSDLLPSDILGVTIFRPDQGDFQFKRGPVFANILLADEINRATPKTQSALLEAMNERRVTLDDQTHLLPTPFLVLATQNPAEYHGTFPLPESQLDRFLMRIRIGYPEPAEEKRILSEVHGQQALDTLRPALTTDDVNRMAAEVRTIRQEDSLLDYLLAIVTATRQSAAVAVGASPRGALALQRAAQARAYLDNRDFCIPDDVKEMAVPVLAHRLMLRKKYSHLANLREEAENLVHDILRSVRVPA